MATRLLRNDLLEHPVRDAIVQLIEDRPGIAFMDLFGQLKPVPTFSSSLGYGSLSYHLHQLERFGLITTRRAGRFRRHFVNGCPAANGHATELAFLQAEPVEALARLVLANPGWCQRQLWDAMQLQHPVSRQLVSYHLVRLERHGLVTSERKPFGKAYAGTVLLSDLLRFVAAPPDPQPAALLALAVPIGQKT